MKKVIMLNPDFSTTRMLAQEYTYTDKNNKDILFLSTNFDPKMSGGLREKGYLKYSYSYRKTNDSLTLAERNTVKDHSFNEESSLCPLSLSPNFHASDIPLVTISTVVFNGDKYLEETVQSVFNQNYNNIEYIIIDGGSTDNTLEIIRKYEQAIDYWISEPDEGIYDAMNKGIVQASGEIIGILNSDDLYLENTVKEVVYKYKKTGKPCVIYGNMLKFFDQNDRQFSFHKGDLSDTAFQKLRISINHPTCFVHRNIYHNLGSFNSKYELGADRELMMRFHKNNVLFIYLDKVLAKFRLGGTTSAQTMDNIFRALVQEYELLNEYKINNIKLYAAILNKFIHRTRKLILYKIIGSFFTNKLIILYLKNKGRISNILKKRKLSLF